MMGGLLGVGIAISTLMGGVSVCAFMPVKRRVDHLVEDYFTTKSVVVGF